MPKRLEVRIFEEMGLVEMFLGVLPPIPGGFVTPPSSHVSGNLC